MFSRESLGYRVDVRTGFDLGRSNPLQKHYFFFYTVTITNNGGTPARLESRTWIIHDSDGNENRVEGPGVVGQTPWFVRGGHFEYSSFCPLPTLAGKMSGQFHMRTEDGEEFSIATPVFRFAVPEDLIDRY